MISTTTNIPGIDGDLQLQARQPDRVDSFAAVLGRTEAEGGERSARGAAEDLVASAFLAPVLQQIRETSDAAPPFQPTPAEKQFGQLLDVRTAKEIVRSSDLPIVDRLAETIDRLSGRGDRADAAASIEVVA
ncbi:MAG: hypothetical protein AAFR96_00365 [Planctomycetota bacterium]